MAKLRLDKYLADMQLGTRSEVKEYIRKGRICVNGEIVRSPEEKIDTASDTEVTLDGKSVRYVETEYYMLNKPAGVLSAANDKKATTVVDLIDLKNRKDLFPVGRLDKDTEGLLLITNDGALSHNLLTPKKHVDKVYYAKVKGCIGQKEIDAFANGVKIHEDFTALPAKLVVTKVHVIDFQEAQFEQDSQFDQDSQDAQEAESYSEILVTIQEGKFHQVKKMFEAVDSEVLYLKRLSMGNLQLDESLEPGEYRKLTEAEITALRQS